MSKYGYDSIRKTVAELESLPKPLSGMSLNNLREAQRRLREARAEILETIPVDEIDKFIDGYRVRMGFALRQDGHNSLCENGHTLIANFQAVTAPEPVALPCIKPNPEQLRDQMLNLARKQDF